MLLIVSFNPYIDAIGLFVMSVILQTCIKKSLNKVYCTFWNNTEIGLHNLMKITICIIRFAEA